MPRGDLGSRHSSPPLLVLGTVERAIVVTSPMAQHDGYIDAERELELFSAYCWRNAAITHKDAASIKSLDRLIASELLDFIFLISFAPPAPYRRSERRAR